MRVKSLLALLQKIDGAKCHVLQELDSLDYGEGYEIRIYGVVGRVYDDERSDEALTNADFINKKISWSEAMNEASKKLKGEVMLKIEIDRFSESKAEIQQDVIQSLKQELLSRKLNVA